MSNVASVNDHPATGPVTTVPGLPTLWGMAEIQRYAEMLAAREPDRFPVLDDGSGRRLTRSRADGWTSSPTFPEPVAKLEMGWVYLADVVRPWVDNMMQEADKHAARRRGLDPALVKQIYRQRGRITQARCASVYGVSLSSVQRIWAGGDPGDRDAD